MSPLVSWIFIGWLLLLTLFVAMTYIGSGRRG